MKCAQYKCIPVASSQNLLNQLHLVLHEAVLHGHLFYHAVIGSIVNLAHIGNQIFIHDFKDVCIRLLKEFQMGFYGRVSKS